jgi:hypothetical protein
MRTIVATVSSHFFLQQSSLEVAKFRMAVIKAASVFVLILRTHSCAGTSSTTSKTTRSSAFSTRLSSLQLERMPLWLPHLKSLSSMCPLKKSERIFKTRETRDRSRQSVGNKRKITADADVPRRLSSGRNAAPAVASRPQNIAAKVIIASSFHKTVSARIRF